MSSNCLSFVSRRWAVEQLKQEWAKDFWRELGDTEIPDHCYFISDSQNIAVIEVFDGICGIHIAIKPELRGMAGIEFGKNAISFAAESTKSIMVLARIQLDRLNVIAYAKQCGMVEYSRNKTHIFLEIKKCHLRKP